MVSLTIDGKAIEVPEGTTVLRAAEGAGIAIPTLCDHKELAPYGGCRLCLVEIDGFRTLQPSCTLPVSANMVVHTDTERVKAARKFVLTLIFSERNHFCPFCQVSGGDCELQNAAYGQGMTHWPLQPNWKPYEVDASHPYIIIDHNRCILCRRCVRACGELVGNFTLGFEERGANSFLVADLGTPLGESTCIGCGTCLQVCPTGAIIDRASAYHGKETQVEHHQTVCQGCSLGCGIDALVRDNQVVRIEGDWMAVANSGLICKTGRFVPMYDERERIHTPMVRRDGKLTAATWDEAIDAIVSELKSASGVAATASTTLTAEDLYLFKKLFKDGLKSDMVTSLEEGAFTAASSSVRKDLGKGFEGKLSALESADCVVTVDFDMTASHEVASFFVKRQIPNGTSLVVVDTEKNASEELASAVIKGKGDSSADLVKGLTAAVLKLGLAKVKSAMDAGSVLEASAKKTGVSTDEFLKAAAIIGKAARPVYLYGKKIAGSNPDALKALIELAEITGGLSEKYSGLLSPKGKANSMAAAQFGLDKAFAVNGHKAAFVVLGDEDPSQKMIQTLSKIPFTVVQASYASQLTANAQVVLPAANWSEAEGHFLSFDGTLQKADKIINPVEGVRTNKAIFEELGAKLKIKMDDKAWKDELMASLPTLAVK